jgi:hypothetical protein
MPSESDRAVVSVKVDNATLKHQLSTLRLLCSQIGFALDTAILSLTEDDDHD